MVVRCLLRVTQTQTAFTTLQLVEMPEISKEAAEAAAAVLKELTTVMVRAT